MDGLVEVKGIEPCLLFAQFIEKWVFIMPCCILNFSRFFPSHPGIPLTIFLVISRNILSSDLELVVSGGRGFVLCWYFISNTFNTFSYLVYCIIFSWINIFPSTGQDIFSSLSFCIVSIWGHFKFVSVTRGIKLEVLKEPFRCIQIISSRTRFFTSSFFTSLHRVIIP